MQNWLRNSKVLYSIFIQRVNHLLHHNFAVMENISEINLTVDSFQAHQIWFRGWNLEEVSPFNILKDPNILNPLISLGELKLKKEACDWEFWKKNRRLKIWVLMFNFSLVYSNISSYLISKIVDYHIIIWNKCDFYTPHSYTSIKSLT